MNSNTLFAPVYLSNGLNAKRILSGTENQTMHNSIDTTVSKMKYKKARHTSYKDKRPSPIDTDISDDESNQVALQVFSTFNESKRIGLWITQGIIDSRNSCNHCSSFVIYVSKSVRDFVLAEGLIQNQPMSWVYQMYKLNMANRSIFDQLRNEDIDEIKRRMRYVDEKIRQRNDREVKV